MSDTPASWQPDPTGRHDHRYWDGSQWTDHVADAGVAATDPYDGDQPPAPVPTEAETETAAEAEAGSETDTERETGGGSETGTDDTTALASGPAATASGWGAVDEPAVGADEPPRAEEPVTPTTTSGWARPDEPAPAVSGWRAADPSGSGAVEDASATPPAEETTAVTPAASWGEETAVTDAAATTTSTWTAPAEPVPPADAADRLAAPAPSSDELPPAERRSKKGLLLLVLALLVIVAVIVALVLVSDDDDDAGDDDAIVDRISSTLQDDLGLDARPADCIGEHIVDEMGASRLQDVDFDAPRAPADLEDDFNDAFQAAIDACDVDREDLRPGGGESGAGDEDGDDASPGADTGELAALLSRSYQSTLGLPEDKASCLADRMARAVESGELSEDEAFQEFADYLDDCQITLEQLNPTTVAG